MHQEVSEQGERTIQSLPGSGDADERSSRLWSSEVQSPSDQARPVLHASHTNALVRGGDLGKPNPIILNLQLESSGQLLHLQFDVPGFAMFDGIGESLLNHAVEVNARRHGQLGQQSDIPYERYGHAIERFNLSG